MSLAPETQKAYRRANGIAAGICGAGSAPIRPGVTVASTILMFVILFVPGWWMMFRARKKAVSDGSIVSMKSFLWMFGKPFLAAMLLLWIIIFISR